METTGTDGTAEERSTHEQQAPQGPGRWSRLIVVVLSVIICYVPAFYGKVALVKHGISTNDTAVSLVLPALSLALMAATVAAVRRRFKNPACLDIRWFGDSRRALILGTVALAVIALTVYALVGSAALKLGVPAGGRVFLSTETPGITFLILRTLLAVLVTPVVEELFWRGYVQGCLQRAFGARLAVVTQAVAFALVHLVLRYSSSEG